MTKCILIFLLIIVISCNSGEQQKHGNIQSVDIKKTGVKKSPENIRLDFSAKFSHNFKETIEINATLFNDRMDTVYFLSSTCYGTQYSLQYDTSIFKPESFIDCNGSSPGIEKINPKGQYTFETYFKYKSNVTKIKLGFDIYEVDKAFDLTSIDLNSGIHFFDIIHYRKENEKSIIWADEKQIK